MPESLFPQAVNLTLAVAQVEALKAARQADNLPTNARLRGLLEVWANDPDLQAEVIRIGRLQTVDVSPTSGKRWTERMLLEFTSETHAKLTDAYIEDGVPVSTRIRALITVWVDSPALQKRAAQAGKLQTVKALRRSQS